MDYRQVDLVSVPDGTARLQCWLSEKDCAKVNFGDRFTLKETGDITWAIVCRYDLRVPEDSFNRKWNVGGLA